MLPSFQTTDTQWSAPAFPNSTQMSGRYMELVLAGSVVTYARRTDQTRQFAQLACHRDCEGAGEPKLTATAPIFPPEERAGGMRDGMRFLPQPEWLLLNGQP